EGANMTTTRALRAAALALAAVALAGPAFANPPTKKEQPAVGEPAPPPAPAEVRSLTVYPNAIELKGGDAARQLVVTAALAGDRLADLTGAVKYEVADPKVARVTSSGRVVPLADGTTEITATYGDRTVRVALKAESVGEHLPVSFANQVVPVFTKLGCNSGG